MHPDPAQTRRLTLRAAALLLLVLPLRLGGQAINTDRAGVALGGYDAVAYHEDQRAVPGTADLIVQHDGATYRFSTAAHRDAFAADPAPYLPAYGGYCAYGVSRGYKVKVDPEAFTLVEGRLYLNYDKGVQGRWLKDIPGYVAKADANWPGLKDQPRR
ncbi:MAG: YHS domain protein [Gemmatimonadetes bacterium]|nr:YHS domain protein [Gemmatimonadota bacterium]MBK6780026.1 YHS domain protein [Gemmatimonadota bacterium]MBK7716851.1 YHS domain protein [Gemmatimonadota bacterium]MBK7785872.1 YHS domain protein [Gemmatimonadota bacterium]MBK7922295.1 YHS domain protein [Gemmatimonadota bacterium]